jgi:hypothetical protein
LPIERDGNRWFLKRELAERWYRLEVAFMQTILILSDPLKVTLTYPAPVSFGYTHTFTHPEFTKRCVKRSRDAFVVLMGTLTYLIDRWELDKSAWTEELKSRRGVHDDWIKLLKETQICDFDTPRVGSVVTADCNWLPDLPMMMGARIPLWLRWNRNDPLSFAKTAADVFRPSKIPPKPCMWPPPITFITHQKTPANDDSSASPVTAESPGAIPEPHRHSGQKKGELWKDFLARRAERRLQLEAAESEKARRSRLDRESASMGGGCPGSRSKVKVWQWVVDPETNFRLRTEVYKREWEDMWENYKPSQRAYDGFANEWDICTEFDPSDSPPPGDFYDDEDDDDGGFTDMAFADGGLQEPSWNTVYGEDVHDALGYETEVGNEWIPAALESTMYLRYGLICCEDWADGFEREGVKIEEGEFVKTMRILVEEDEHLDDEGFKKLIVTFTRCLLDRQSAPSLVWDLGGHRPLDRWESLPFQIKHIALEDGDCYTFESSAIEFENGPRWILALKEPTTVLQCLRLKLKPGKFEIANYLLSVGLPFKTLVPGPPPRHFARSRFSRGLGYRPHGYKPDMVDYAVYERDRSAVASGPSGRAGRLMGGIVARLIMDAIDNDTVAIAGPSDVVFEYGTGFRTKGGYLWDDALSDEELDIICGVYKVRSRECLSVECAHLIGHLQTMTGWSRTPPGGLSTRHGSAVDSTSATGPQPARNGTKGD